MYVDDAGFMLRVARFIMRRCAEDVDFPTKLFISDGRGWGKHQLNLCNHHNTTSLNTTTFVFTRAFHSLCTIIDCDEVNLVPLLTHY